MIGRLLFASVGVAIFLISLTCGILGAYAIPAVIVSLLVIFVVLNLSGDTWGQRLNGFVGFFLKTNNRWLLTMAVFTAISFGFAITTPTGSSIIKQGVEDTVRNSEAQKLTDIRERYHNLYNTGKYKTNAELGQQPQPAPVLESWTPWWIRWLGTCLLFCLTVGYIPFAFADEVRAAAARTHTHFSERTHGEAGEPWYNRVMDIMHRLSKGQQPVSRTVAGTTTTANTTATVGTTPQSQVAQPAAPATVWPSVLKMFISELLAELVGERFFGKRR